MTKRRLPRWLTRIAESIAFFDLIVVTLALFAVLSGVRRALGTGRVLTAAVLALTGLAIVALTLMRLHTLVVAAKNEERIGPLVSALDTLRKALETAYGTKGTDPRLRLTLLVPVEGGRLRQLVDYVGDNRGGATAGREFSADSGIAGKAFRTREMYRATRSSSSDYRYVEDLVTTWGFSQEEAVKRDRLSRSWMAVPINAAGSDVPLGVLYLDSTAEDFFTAPLVDNVILPGTSTIAFYFGMAYNGS